MATGLKVISIALAVLAACSGDDGSQGWVKKSTTQCDGLRGCCASMSDETSRKACLQSVDSQANNTNAEQWCQSALNTYAQLGLCANGKGGASGAGGLAGAGGACTSGGTSGVGAFSGSPGNGGVGGSSGHGGGYGGGTGGYGGGTGGYGGGSGGTSGSCAHDVCIVGDVLEAACSPCVSTVCASDAYCCTTKWNSYCVDGAKKSCGACGGAGASAGGAGGSAGAGSCSHDVCTTGGALAPTCSSCASTVCGADPYCCTTSWNSYCVDGAKKLCNECGGTGGSGG